MPQLKDLHIRITSRCNFNCLHCYAGDWLKENYELNKETTISIIDQAIALGCTLVTFTGGEPLVAKATIPAILHCLDKNVEVEIETNGVLLGTLLKSIKTGLDKIEFAISYDGKKLRDVKFAKIVKDNIKQVQKLGCSVKIQTVITEINLDEAYEIFDFSKELGITNRVFLAHSPNGNAKNIPLFSVSKWLDILADLRKRYSHLSMEIPKLFVGAKPKNCGWGFSRCEIMPNGDVTSCAPITFNKRDFIAGNIKDASLAALWNSPHFQKIRKLTQKDYKGLCSKCPHWNQCKGACRSISYATGNDLMATHPFCYAFFKELTEGKIDITNENISSMAKEWFIKLSNPDLALL